MGSSPSQQRAASAAVSPDAATARSTGPKATAFPGPAYFVHDPSRPVSSVFAWPTMLNSIEEGWITTSDRTVRICAVDGGVQCRLLKAWRTDTRISAAAIYREKLLITAESNSNIEMWNLLPMPNISQHELPSNATRPLSTSLPQLPRQFPPCCMAAPKGKNGPDHMVTGARDTSVTLWDVVRGEAVRSVKTSRNIVSHVSFNPVNDTQFAQTGEDRILKLWDTRCLDSMERFPVQNNILSDCDVYDDGYTISTTTSGGQVLIWDSRFPESPTRTFGPFRSLRFRTIFCPGTTKSQYWAASVGDGDLSVWDVRDQPPTDQSAFPAKSNSLAVDGNPMTVEWCPIRMKLCCAGQSGGVAMLGYSNRGTEFNYIGTF